MIPTKTEKPEQDLLAEATNGKLHWDDPGMNRTTNLEEVWKEFPLGTRVEIQTGIRRVETQKQNCVWRKGTVVETPEKNDRAIVVECDEKWHDNLDFYKGHGAAVMVYLNTARGILSNIRKID